jgi:hypothetical protein
MTAPRHLCWAWHPEERVPSGLPAPARLVPLHAERVTFRPVERYAALGFDVKFGLPMRFDDIWGVFRSISGAESPLRRR